MPNIIILQMPLFKKAYKKLHIKEQKLVGEAIRQIEKNPNLGEKKRGDLRNVFVYKFKIHHQEFLLAYEWNSKERILMALGAHENFYRDLKKNLKETSVVL